MFWGVEGGGSSEVKLLVWGWGLVFMLFLFRKYLVVWFGLCVCVYVYV